MPSAVLIFNTRAGSHVDRARPREEAIAALRDAGLSVNALKGPVDRQVRQSLSAPQDIVAVGGGDGTIRAVVAAHRGRGRPIGILPGGTMNFLANDLGIPEDFAGAARVIAGGHTRCVDCALIDGHVFLHAALTGMPTRLAVHRERRRGSLRLRDWVALAVHGITTLPRDPELRVTAVDAEGHPVEVRAQSLAFVVGVMAPQLLPRPRRESLDEGLMTLFALHPDSGVDVARLLMRTAVGDVGADPHAERTLVRSAGIRGERRRLHATLDGESRLLRIPCAVEVRSGEIAVFAPPTAGEGQPPVEPEGRP